MLEILGTYDDKGASEAKDDALQCILHCINKPDVYIMDHLLQLKPVIALEGQQIFKVSLPLFSHQSNPLSPTLLHYPYLDIGRYLTLIILPYRVVFHRSLSFE